MSLRCKVSRTALRNRRRPGLARVRRGSLAVLVLVVAEYVIGMYVNLYVTYPPGRSRPRPRDRHRERAGDRSPFTP